MKKLLFLAFLGILLISCNSEKKFDIEKVAFGEDMAKLLQPNPIFKQEAKEGRFYNEGFVADNSDYFKYKDFQFSPTNEVVVNNVANGRYADQVVLMVDSKDGSTYKGSIVKLVTQDQGEKFMQYLTKEYGKMTKSNRETADSYNGYWLVKDKNLIIFVEHYMDEAEEGHKVPLTNFYIMQNDPKDGEPTMLSAIDRFY